MGQNVHIGLGLLALENQSVLEEAIREEYGYEQKKNTNANATFASAHHGVASGEPMYAI